MPVTTACSQPSYRRHRVRTALTHTRGNIQGLAAGRAVCPAGYPTHKECAVPEKTNREQRPKERTERSAPRSEKELGSLDVWARSAPIRLAGYEDDLAEPHILPSVD